MAYTVEQIQAEFIAAYPNVNNRASTELPYGAVYVHFLESELIKAREGKRIKMPASCKECPLCGQCQHDYNNVGCHILLGMTNFVSWIN